MTDAIDKHLNTLKILKSTTSEGITELESDKILTWYNTNKKKYNYVEPFVEEIKRFNWLKTKDWLKYHRDFTLLGYPVVTSIPTTVTFIVLKKNTMIVPRRH